MTGTKCVTATLAPKLREGGEVGISTFINGCTSDVVQGHQAQATTCEFDHKILKSRTF